MSRDVRPHMSNPSRPLKWHTIKDAEAASGRDLIGFRRCCGYGMSVSLAEIEQAVKELSREELAKLAAFIARQDKLVWDEELEQDSSPGGKHAAALEKIDAEIGAGNFRPMP